MAYFVSGKGMIVLYHNSLPYYSLYLTICLHYLQNVYMYCDLRSFEFADGSSFLHIVAARSLSMLSYYHSVNTSTM